MARAPEKKKKKREKLVPEKKLIKIGGKRTLRAEETNATSPKKPLKKRKRKRAEPIIKRRFRI